MGPIGSVGVQRATAFGSVGDQLGVPSPHTEGGHGAGSTNAQRAYSWALTYAYLWKQLR